MKLKEYDVKFLPAFCDQFEIDKKDPIVAKKIKTVIDTFKKGPYRKSKAKKLEGVLEKFWRWRPNNIRIIYQVCGYCRKRGYYSTLSKMCPTCEFPDNTVMLFYYGPRNDKKVYKDFKKMVPR